MLTQTPSQSVSGFTQSAPVVPVVGSTVVPLVVSPAEVSEVAELDIETPIVPEGAVVLVELVELAVIVSPSVCVPALELVVVAVPALSPALLPPHAPRRATRGTHADRPQRLPDSAVRRAHDNLYPARSIPTSIIHPRAAGPIPLRMRTSGIYPNLSLCQCSMMVDAAWGAGRW